MNDLRVLTVIQARTGSSRLPGKVLLPLGNSNVLVEMWKRLQGSRLKGQVVVATTHLSDDNRIAELCATYGMNCFRGHPTDLLDRHYRAMCVYKADVVVKIPSDCPLIDPEIVDRVIGSFLAAPDRYDYVSNLHPPSYPDGNDVEVMRGVALAAAWREAVRGIDREHTTAFLWDNPQRFRIGNVLDEKGVDRSHSHRWTLDYAEDYQLIRAVFETLAPASPKFGSDEIVALMERTPSLRELNRRYLGDSWYQRHRHELNTLKPTSPEVSP